jgi:MFS family permease
MGEGMGYLGLGTTVALAAGPLFGIWIMNDLGFFVMFATVSACYLLGIAVVGALPNISLVSAGPGIPRYRPILFSKLVRLPSLLMFILGLILSAIIIYMALFCEERGIPYAGHFFVLSTISIVISRLYAGRIHDRLGHRFVVIPAIMLLCITALLVFFARDGLLIFIASILYGFGLGAIFPSMTALTLSYAPLERRTEVTASFFNSYDLGFGAGSMLMGHVAELAGSYEVVFMSSAGMAALFLLVYSVYYLVLKKA